MEAVKPLKIEWLPPKKPDLPPQILRKFLNEIYKASPYGRPAITTKSKKKPSALDVSDLPPWIEREDLNQRYAELVKEMEKLTRKPAVRKPKGSVKMVGDDIHLTHPDGVTDIISKERYEMLLAGPKKPVVRKKKRKETPSFATPEMIAKNIREQEESDELLRERMEEAMRRKGMVPPSDKAKARKEMFKDYGIAGERGGDDLRIRRIAPRTRKRLM